MRTSGWMKLGNAPVFVNEEGVITKGCEGLRGHRLDDLEETQHERAEKQDQAEDAGWTSAKSDRARDTWEEFKQSNPDHEHFIGLVRHGGKFHSFGDDARKLHEHLGIGDGETAEFDEDTMQHHVERLVEGGHRVAVIDREEDGEPNLDSEADPQAAEAVEDAHEDMADDSEAPWSIPFDQMLSSDDARRKHRDTYFSPEGTLMASTRTVPSEWEKGGIKPGTWIVNKGQHGLYGHDIVQLQMLDPHELELMEDDYTTGVNTEGRGDDAHRYADWLREGKTPPPIHVVEKDDGGFRLTDGHRRVAAAKMAGKPVPALVSPSAELDKKDYNGNPIKVALTYEMAMRDAIRQGKKVPTEVLQSEKSRLEGIVAKLEEWRGSRTAYEDKLKDAESHLQLINGALGQTAGMSTEQPAEAPQEQKPLWQQTLRDAIPDDRIDDQSAFDEHRQAVEQALQSGQDVPSEVLEDYPDIREQLVKSQSEKSEDVLGQLQDRDELSRDDIGRLLASQHHNVESRAQGVQARDAESLADRWVDSPSFVKMEIPIDIARPATAVQQGDSSVSPEAPIIVDTNKTGSGRLHGSFGAPAEFLILDGKHRHAEAKARGETTITAFVGSNAVPKIKAMLGQSAASAAKEPWQMTYEELRDAVSPHNRETLEASRPILKSLYPPDDARISANEQDDPWGIHRAITKGDSLPRVPVVDLGSRHKQAIKQALAEGKSVPAEVLADWPELQQEKTAEHPDSGMAVERGAGWIKQQFPHGARRDQAIQAAKTNWANNSQARAAFKTMDEFAAAAADAYQSDYEAGQERERQASQPRQPQPGEQVQGHDTPRVSNEEWLGGNWDMAHAGLGTEPVMAKMASGMKGIEGREYGIRQHSPGKWQVVSRKPEQQATAQQPTEQTDTSQSDAWNRATSNPQSATPQDLRDALRFAGHLHAHHGESLRQGKISKDQHDRALESIDSNVAKIQSAMKGRHEQNQPTAQQAPTPAGGGAGPGGIADLGDATAAGGLSADSGHAGSSIPERHAATATAIAKSPKRLRGLLESMHRLRDTRKHGTVRTSELGHDFAKQIYDHLQSRRNGPGDRFGEIHDLSDDLGHGAIGYSSPGGNLAIVPPQFKGQDWDVRYTLPHESQLAPKQPVPKAPKEPKPPREPKPKKPRGVNPNTKLGRAVIDAVGDDPADQEAFKGLVQQIWEEENKAAIVRNSALRNLLGQFGFEGRDAATFIRTLKRYADRGGDADTFTRKSKLGKKWDQMVEYATKYHPELLTYDTGESAGSGDAESALLNRFLQGGLERPPQPYDDEIIAKALEYVSGSDRQQREHEESMQNDPEYRAHIEDWESRQFARTGVKFRYRRWLGDRLSRWRRYAKQMSFEWDEEKHPRDDSGQFTEKSGGATSTATDTEVETEVFDEPDVPDPETSRRHSVGPAGKTRAEVAAEIMGDSKRETMNYDQSCRATWMYTGSDPKKWSAVPIKGTHETTTPNGQSVTLPVFEIPVDYTPLETFFQQPQGGMGGGCCELCGHTIKTAYHLQNDEDKKTMVVGSECVTQFGQGKSGKRLTKEAQWTANRDLLKQTWDARESLAQHFGYFDQKKEQWEIHNEHGVREKILGKMGYRYKDKIDKEDEAEASQTAKEVFKLWRQMNDLVFNSKGEPVHHDKYDHKRMVWYQPPMGYGRGGSRVSVIKYDPATNQVISSWVKRNHEKIGPLLDDVDRLTGRNTAEQEVANDSVIRYLKRTYGGSWRKYARQLAFSFNEDEHPRAKESVTIEGTDYRPGEFIPKDKAEEATPEEQEKIEVVDSETGEKKPLDEHAEEQESTTRWHVTPHGEQIKKEGFATGKGKGIGGPVAGEGVSVWKTEKDADNLLRHTTNLENIRTSNDPIATAEKLTGRPITDTDSTASLYKQSLTDAQRAVVHYQALESPYIPATSFFTDTPKRSFEKLAVQIGSGARSRISDDSEELYDPEHVTLPKSAAKPTWQMTRGEFHQASKDQPGYDMMATNRAHKQAVADAIDSGADVPLEAYRDYPDLKELAENRPEPQPIVPQDAEVEAATVATQQKLFDAGVVTEPPTPAAKAKATVAAGMKKGIEDFGEKLGGARKDTAKPTGPRLKREKDDEDEGEAWLKRYMTMQNNKTGKWMIADKGKKENRWGMVQWATRQEFDTEAEAEAAIPLVAVGRNHRVRNFGTSEHPNYGIYREISDRKRPIVKDGFQTEKEAMTYMALNPKEIATFKTRIDDSIHPALERIDRKGHEHRPNDRPATPEDFNVFGFRGIEFGNWNNQAERQHILNHAYDSMMDLAAVLNLPPSAISLNGQLGLAFGARGTGGLQSARAHYEPDYDVINLTKIKGAGAMAHEWMHALDHYMARKTGMAKSDKKANARGDMVYEVSGRLPSEGWSYNAKVDPDLKAAWDKARDAIHYRTMKYTDDESLHEKRMKKTSDYLQQHVDAIRKEFQKDHSGERYTRYKGKRALPASPEMMKQVNDLLDKIQAGDLGENVYAGGQEKRRAGSFNLGTRMPANIAKLSELHKQLRGNQGYYKDASGRLGGPIAEVMNYAESKVRADKLLEDAQNQKVKEKKVATEFYSHAKKMDEGATKDYWSASDELMSRAFESFVYDKIKQNDGQNDFLAFEKHNDYWAYKMFGLKPYPEREERDTINQAFNELVSTLKPEDLGGGGERPKSTLNPVSATHQPAAEEVQEPAAPKAEPAGQGPEDADKWLEYVSSNVNRLQTENSGLLMKKGMTDRYRNEVSRGGITQDRFDELVAGGHALNDEDYAKAVAVQKQIDDIRSTKIGEIPEEKPAKTKAEAVREALQSGEDIPGHEGTRRVNPDGTVETIQQGKWTPVPADIVDELAAKGGFVGSKPVGSSESPIKPDKPTEETVETAAETVGSTPADLTFPSAAEAAKSGKSYNDWTQPISDAFVSEKIGDDHPAWQSIQHGNGPNARTFNEARDIYGQHVRFYNHGTNQYEYGKVTDFSPDLKTAEVTDSSGNKRQMAFSEQHELDHLGSVIQDRMKRGRPINAELGAMLPDIASQILDSAGDQPITADHTSAVLKAHGLPTDNPGIKEVLQDELLAQWNERNHGTRNPQADLPDIPPEEPKPEPKLPSPTGPGQLRGQEKRKQTDGKPGGQELKHRAQDYGVLGDVYADVAKGMTFQESATKRIAERQAQEAEQKAAGEKRADQKQAAIDEWAKDLPKYSDAELQSELEQHKAAGRTTQQRHIESEMERRKPADAWHSESFEFNDGTSANKYTAPDGKHQIWETDDGKYELSRTIGGGVAKENVGEFETLDEAKQAAAPAKIDTSSVSKTYDPEQHGGYKPLLAVAEKVRSGEMTADQYKQEYAFWRKHEAEHVADLQKRFNAKQLTNIAGNMGDYNAKGNNKKQNAQSVYEKLLMNAFHIGGTFSYGMEGRKAALDKHVSMQTDEKLQAAKQQSEAEDEKQQEAIQNPKTVSDFHQAIRHHGGYQNLPEPHKAAYDDLVATQRREGDKSRKSTVQAFQGTTGAVGIVEGHHQKRNAPTWTVTVEEHLGDDWQPALSRAKQLGGSYVNKMIARRYGATPGFQFFTKDGAEKFAQTLKGEDVDRSEMLQERQIAKIDNAGERLEALAELTRQRAESALNAPRQTNTARRAEMAAGAESHARSEIAKARTLTRIAEGLKSNTLRHLSGIRTKTHVDALDASLSRARYRRFQDADKAGRTASGHSSVRWEDFKESPYGPDDVSAVQYPYPAIWASDLNAHINDFAEIPGMKNLARSLRKTADVSPYSKKVAGFTTTGGKALTKSDLRESIPYAATQVGDKAIRVHASQDPALLRGRHQIAYTADKGKTWGISPEIAVQSAMLKQNDLDLIDPPQDERLEIKDEHTIGQLAKVVSTLKRKSDPRLRRIGESIGSSLEDYNRLQAADIKSPQELRAALREYLPLKAAQDKEDPVKAKERALIGTKIPGFFPTPRPLIDNMLSAADIQPGMSVLEPSAGKGDIIDAIKETDPEATVVGIEPQYSLREILSAKGHEMAEERDFLEHRGQYERIVMNPPFENRQDVKHVQHAFGLLKPGGRLVAIMSSSPFHGSSNADREFQNWLEETGAEVQDNPEGSFTGSDAFRQTGVNTKMVVIDKPLN